MYTTKVFNEIIDLYGKMSIGRWYGETTTQIDRDKRLDYYLNDILY